MLNNQSRHQFYSDSKIGPKGNLHCMCVCLFIPPKKKKILKNPTKRQTTYISCARWLAHLEIEMVLNPSLDKLNHITESISQAMVPVILPPIMFNCSNL